MAINVFPVDAVAGEPEYSGRDLRQALSALIAGASADRPLGATSGVRVGTPDTTVEADASTWTVHPHSGILDVQTAVEAGPYLYAIDADVAGAMDPAHATNPRIDIITVRLDDPAESDGSSVPGVAVVYKAGTAASSPVQPTPDTSREMLLASIAVPASGGGSPAVSWVAHYAAASGGIIPVRNSTERDAVGSAMGTVLVRRLDAPAGMEHEYTTNSGSTWRTLSGFEASTTPQSFTPSLLATVTNPVIGAGGVQAGRYWYLPGRMIHVEGMVRYGTSGNNFGSGSYRIGNLPEDISSTWHGIEGTTGLATPIGNVVFRDNSDAATSPTGLCVAAGTDQFGFQTSAGSRGLVSATVPITFSTLDAITFSVDYHY